MATKRKALGYAARQTIVEIDLELASGDNDLTPLVEGENMLRSEVSLRAAIASRKVREARRKLQPLLTEAQHESTA